MIAYKSNEVKTTMSFRLKAVSLIAGLAVAAGILLSSHLLKHALSGVASAVWGS
jgi:hypothetical protein